MAKIVAQFTQFSEQNDLFQTVGQGKTSSWKRNYLSFDSTQNKWSILSLNFFERVGRRVFGLYKSTHLKNVIAPLQQSENVPQELANRLNQLWVKTHPREGQVIAPEVQVETIKQKPQIQAKTFYTQDDNGQVQAHQLVLDPFRFADEGIVCLPNPGSRCWIVSFLQIFAKDPATINLKGLNLSEIESSKDILPRNWNQPTEAKLAEINQHIVKIAQAVEGRAGVDPSAYIPDLFNDQITFEEKYDQTPLMIPENSHSLYIANRGFDGVVTKPEEIEMHVGDYALKGIISYVDGHFYTQIPKENDGKIDWYQCGRFAALSESADPIIPVDETSNPAITAIIEKTDKPILEKNLAQFFVYQKV